ncbi:MAG: hypothetical protein KAF91_26795 [Nostoc sp. TH1S01]|nr:hypothetical protein [Nostoc sp. TH1S01]
MSKSFGLPAECGVKKPGNPTTLARLSAKPLTAMSPQRTGLRLHEIKNMYARSLFRSGISCFLIR